MGSGSSRPRAVRYAYERDGVDSEGERIPDIPVVTIMLEVEGRRGRGPAVVDTGFDGGVYPNLEVVRLFRGLKPMRVKYLESPLYGRVACEVYVARLSLLEPGGGWVGLGECRVYIPVEPELLSEEVLLGREVLNRLVLALDGRVVEVRVPE